MGFDMTAQQPRKKGSGYYRANVFWMTVLRCSMLASGVKEKLIYQKFLCNDGWRVTPLQAGTIADKLTAWLKGRNLVIELFESNEQAMRVNDALSRLFGALKGSRAKKASKRSSGSRSTPLKVDRRIRRELRQFAEFCQNSCGFWIE
jgi:hypothetical protein